MDQVTLLQDRLSVIQNLGEQRCRNGNLIGKDWLLRFAYCSPTNAILIIEITTCFFLKNWGGSKRLLVVDSQSNTGYHSSPRCPDIPYFNVKPFPYQYLVGEIEVKDIPADGTRYKHDIDLDQTGKTYVTPAEKSAGRPKRQARPTNLELPILRQKGLGNSPLLQNALLPQQGRNINTHRPKPTE